MMRIKDRKADLERAMGETIARIKSAVEARARLIGGRRARMEVDDFADIAVEFRRRIE